MSDEIFNVKEIVLAIIIGFVLGWGTGLVMNNLMVLNEAHEAGVGEWYLDENNDKQWRWIGKNDKSGS